MREADGSRTTTPTDREPGDVPAADHDGVLVPVDGDPARALFSIACDIVADRGGDLTLAAPVVVRRQTPLDDDGLHERGNDLLAKALPKVLGACPSETAVHQRVRTAHSRKSALGAIVGSDASISTVLADRSTSTDRRPFTEYSVFGSLPLDSHVHSIVAGGLDGLGTIDTIPVPVGRGPHSECAIGVAGSLARRNDSRVTLFHVRADDGRRSRRESERLMAAARSVLDDSVATETSVVAADEVGETIVHQSEGFDITILGAPREGVLRQFVSGSIPDHVFERSPGAVVAVYKRGSDRSWIDRTI
ncbi:MAG: universal stress protein [Halanaeroarchaeum sp.]